MSPYETSLTLVTDTAQKFWEARVEGNVLKQSSRTGKGKPRETSKDFPSGQEAARAFGKAVQKKMADGFAFVRDVASAFAGEVVLDLQAPHGSNSDAFDLSPDGRTLALATYVGDKEGSQLHLVDVATGRMRLLHEEKPTNLLQVFMHAVRFDASGTTLLYTVREQTRRLQLPSGPTEVVASYEQFVSSSFNPASVRPSQNTARSRLLVFDAGNRLRVLGPANETLLEVTASGPGEECRSAALSASGKRLVLFRSKDGGGGYEPLAVEVWDVDARCQVKSIPVPWKIDDVGFDPSETKVLFNHEFAQGPAELSIETGEKLWHQEETNSLMGNRWGTCFSWSYSPDGRMLMVGGFGLHCLDATTHAATELQPQSPPVGQRIRRIAFSQDGSLMAVGGDEGRLLVFKMTGEMAAKPAPAPAEPRPPPRPRPTPPAAVAEMRDETTLLLPIGKGPHITRTVPDGFVYMSLEDDFATYLDFSAWPPRPTIRTDTTRSCALSAKGTWLMCDYNCAWLTDDFSAQGEAVETPFPPEHVGWLGDLPVIFEEYGKQLPHVRMGGKWVPIQNLGPLDHPANQASIDLRDGTSLLLYGASSYRVDAQGQAQRVYDLPIGWIRDAQALPDGGFAYHGNNLVWRVGPGRSKASYEPGTTSKQRLSLLRAGVGKELLLTFNHGSASNPGLNHTELAGTILSLEGGRPKPKPITKTFWGVEKKVVIWEMFACGDRLLARLEDNTFRVMPRGTP